jgi:hypothetical protein
MGWPTEEAPTFVRWTHTLIKSTDMQEVASAVAQIRDYLRQRIADSRAKRGDGSAPLRRLAPRAPRAAYRHRTLAAEGAAIPYERTPGPGAHYGRVWGGRPGPGMGPERRDSSMKILVDIAACVGTMPAAST